MVSPAGGGGFTPLWGVPPLLIGDRRQLYRRRKAPVGKGLPGSIPGLPFAAPATIFGRSSRTPNIACCLRLAAGSQGGCARSLRLGCHHFRAGLANIATGLQAQ